MAKNLLISENYDANFHFWNVLHQRFYFSVIAGVIDGCVGGVFLSIDKPDRIMNEQRNIFFITAIVSSIYSLHPKPLQQLALANE